MGFIDLIERLRDKPEMTRRRILVGTTFTITALIFFFWLSVKLYNTSEPTPADLGVKESGPITETANAIGDFIQGTADRIKAIKNSFNASSTYMATSSSEIEIK